MKKRLSVLLLSIILLFNIVHIQANTEDSLRNVISNTDGVEKLNAIHNLIDLKQHGDDGLDYIIMLEEEARKQNNEFHIGNALTYKALFHAYNGDNEKFYPAAEVALEYLLERENLQFYFGLYSTLIKVYLNEGYYETAFLKISTMLEHAKKFDYLLGEIFVYENMGDAYYIEKHLQKSLESYRKVFSLMSAFPDQLLLRTVAGFRVAENAYDAGEMSLAILYCDSALLLVEEYDNSKTGVSEAFSTSYIKTVLYVILALSYISVDREMDAADAMKMALKYAEDDILESYRRVFNYYCSDYYLKKGEHKTALEYIKKVEGLFAIGSIQYNQIVLMKSKILAAMGDFENAYKIKQEYQELTDSLNRKKLSQRVSELQTIHQVEKLEYQAEQEQLEVANQRQFNIGLMVVVILLACVILIVIRNLNRTKQKNRVLYQRISSQEALELELKRKEDTLRANLLSEDKTSEDVETDQIYLSLKELMKDEKNYIDPNVTRKGIATKLGTNERYLYESITKHLGLSFAEYINLLRLDYAREKMSQYLNELSLEDIAIMSGFGTRQTFHRLFRDRYGLSPSEFSNMLKNF
jgi:Transcriptional regulator containing an amidase domain and an AraC-type DNA-binding HTH domain